MDMPQSLAWKAEKLFRSIPQKICGIGLLPLVGGAMYGEYLLHGDWISLAPWIIGMPHL
jgi:hypothetical protein